MIIQLKNVQKMFASASGIKNIYLDINPGEKVGLIGPNGCGKTTLLRIMQGLLIPNDGVVLHDGISTIDKNFNLANVGYISAHEDLPRKMKTSRYVKLISNYHTHLPNRLKEIANILDFDLSLNTKIGLLSTGMKQKLKLCLVLGFEREIYFLDEPTNGIDLISRERLMDFLKETYKEKTIIYCTHLMEEIASICKEAIIIKNNTIAQRFSFQSKKELLRKYHEAYEYSHQVKSFQETNS